MVRVLHFLLLLLLSAFLLFTIQPMFSRLILPVWGGTPQVWNTSMVFYQMVLFLGYLYSHLLTKYFSFTYQYMLHLLLLLLCIITMIPVDILLSFTTAQENPIVTIFRILFTGIGGVFFLLSATAPLVQRWFSYTTYKHSDNPYFLYAASNLGSMIALLGYPILIEPYFGLKFQFAYWSYGFIVVFVLFLTVVLSLCINLRKPRVDSKDNYNDDNSKKEEEPLGTVNVDVSKVSLKVKLYWLLFSFLPSALLLAVTTYLNDTIPSGSLLWIFPLAIYIGAYIFVFRTKPILSERNTRDFLTYLLICYCVVQILVGSFSNVIAFFFHLLCLWLCVSICLIRLFDLRPHIKHITSFYLWISFGGLLGGMFNAFLVPSIFIDITEYYLLLVVILFITFTGVKTNLLAVNKYAILLGVIASALFYFLLYDKAYFSDYVLYFLVGSLLFCLAYLRMVKLVFALVIGVFFYSITLPDKILYKERNFFGSCRVVNKGSVNLLFHGSTIHGIQYRDKNSGFAIDYEKLPVSYYSYLGPYADLMSYMEYNCINSQNIAALGLGVGVVSAYGHAYQNFDFYEINPDLIAIAKNPAYFTYLNNTEASHTIYQGDARVLLQQRDSSAPSYDLLFADTFSGDNVPIHLMSKEAVLLYLDKLTKNGILSIHISSRTLDLSGVLEAIANQIPNITILRKTTVSHIADPIYRSMCQPSDCIVFLKNNQQVVFFKEKGWKSIPISSRVPAWTDDYSNILRSLKVFNTKN